MTVVKMLSHYMPEDSAQQIVLEFTLFVDSDLVY